MVWLKRGTHVQWTKVGRSRGSRPRLPVAVEIGKRARLKGLEEFETPEFVGRMNRVARRRKLQWWAMLAATFAVGGAIGWTLI